MFIFDESPRTLRTALRSTIWASGSRRTSTPAAVTVQQVDPAELSPGEFVARDPDRGRGQGASWS